MSIRIVSRRRLKKFSIGDLRERISFYSRDIKSPVFNSAKFTETYTLIADRWASVSSARTAQQFFNNVNVDSQPTHTFVIRFLENITTETRIKWKDKNYEILLVINFEDRDEFLELHSKLLGDDTLEANK